MNAVAAARSRRNARFGGRLPKTRFIGILISAVVPALFWTALLALLGVLWGAPFDVATLGAVAAVIVVFLAIVAGAVVASKDISDE